MKIMKYGKFYAINGMDKTEIECDGEVELHTDDGKVISLQMRQSDQQVSLSVNGQLIVLPYATNVARLDVIK